MTREFQNFLKHFSQEIEAARIDADDLQNNDDLDRVIVQMMELAERVYPEDVKVLLDNSGVARKMHEMKSMVDLNVEHIQGFRLDPGWKEVSIRYFEQDFVRPIFHLEEAMNYYFNTNNGTPEFYFLSAYLAKDDHFIIIQLYHFLTSIRH